MDVSPLKKYLPWKSNTSDMRWNVLLMCKLLFILLMFNGFWLKIQDPYLPFFPILDFFNELPGVFPLVNKILFLTSGLFMLFNIKARVMSSILGITVLVILLGSKPIFRNHVLICGCAFFLAALHKKEENPYLLYFQLGLVYIGAAVNKMFQLDWWNGMYMHHWMISVLDNQPYLWVFENIQNLSFAKGLSWFSMFLEIIVGVFLFFKNYQSWAVYLILFFHLILFTVTQERFGHFLDDILIFLIAFIDKESFQQVVHAKNAWKRPVSYLNRLFDWDGIFKLKGTALKTDSLVIKNKNGLYRDIQAVKHILFSCAGFFYVLFFSDLALRYLLEQPMQHAIQVPLYWGLFLFFAKRWKSNAMESTYSYRN